MRSNFSQVPIAVRFAISGAAPALSAHTYWLLALARKLTVPSGLRMSRNVSHGPNAVRLAINGCAPAFSAVTYWPLDLARSETSPLPRSMRSNCALVPMAPWLAISDDPLGALTYWLSARARRLTVPVGAAAPASPMLAASSRRAAVDGVPDSDWNGWFSVGEPVRSTR